MPGYVYRGTHEGLDTFDAVLTPRPRKPPKPPAPSKRVLRPCGTRSAYMRHKARGEPIDKACEDARREYQRQSDAKHAWKRKQKRNKS